MTQYVWTVQNKTKGCLSAYTKNANNTERKFIFFMVIMDLKDFD
jgi:hypothetical protein